MGIAGNGPVPRDGALSFDYIEAAPPALPKPEEGGPGDGEAEREPEVAE